MDDEYFNSEEINEDSGVMNRVKDFISSKRKPRRMFLFQDKSTAEGFIQGVMWGSDKFGGDVKVEKMERDSPYYRVVLDLRGGTGMFRSKIPEGIPMAADEERE